MKQGVVKAKANNIIKMPRESDSKRHYSRFEREPSPKRSRRNGKPTTERSPNRFSPETRDKDDGRKHRHHLQDPLPLDKLHASESKPNDCSNAAQDGTSTERGGKSERGLWRNQEDDRRGKHAPDKDEKFIARGDDSRVRSHDEPSKTNADQPHPARKKFREEKPPPAESQPAEKAAATIKTTHSEAAAAPRNVRREERGIHRYSDRNERDRGYSGGRFPPNRARSERAGFPSRDRYPDSKSGNRFTGREGGYVGRQGGYPAVGGGRVDKWKHDLFDEVNKSPKSENEKDPVAKAEALLAL